MNERAKVVKTIDSLKLEHLTGGIRPIMACVGSYSDYGVVEKTAIGEKFSEQLGNTHNVDYDGLSSDLAEKKFLGGEGTWTISTIDNLDKFSQGFFDCTGLIVAGRDKETGENISFLSHQDPKKFLRTNRNDFIVHLQQRLIEIKTRCKPGTVDAVVVGGKYIRIPFDHKGTDIDYRQDYLDSIELLSQEVQKTLGFEPVIIGGPKTKRGFSDNIFYKNKDRRLYFIRPRINSATGSFTHSGIDEEKGKWEELGPTNNYI